MSPELVAGLSVGQRAIAHVAVLVVVLVAAGLVYLIRGAGRSGDE